MGFASTRAEARQLVSHKAITVNEEGESPSASYQVKAGDIVQVREKVRAKQLRIASSLNVAQQVGLPDWVEVNDKEFRGVFKDGAGPGGHPARHSTRTWSSSCIRSDRIRLQWVARRHPCRRVPCVSFFAPVSNAGKVRPQCRICNRVFEAPRGEGAADRSAPGACGDRAV